MHETQETRSTADVCTALSTSWGCRPPWATRYPRVYFPRLCPPSTSCTLCFASLAARLDLFAITTASSRSSTQLNCTSFAHSFRFQRNERVRSRPACSSAFTLTSRLKRVNRRPAASAAYTPSPGSTPVLYPPGGGSGRATPSWGTPNGNGSGSGRLSPPLRPASTSSGASQYSESPFGGGMASAPGARTAHELEGHNDDLLRGLLGKVDVLKNVSA
jgi:hypothetical protein